MPVRRLFPRPRAERAVRPFLARDAASVTVGETVLARHAPGQPRLVPSLAGYETSFCLDQPTATTLAFVARAVASARPCLLQGPTAASKTSCVRHLAGLLGRELLWVSLSGSSDSGELVGHYRGAETGGFVWGDGPATVALREGWWLLLDEVNLAEAAVVERLNPLLDRTPGLVLHEHDNRLVAAHPDFRVFATANEQAYAGRQPMSPAWRRRWRARLRVAAPGEADLLHLACLLVFGEQPPVTVDGIAYAGSRGPARHPGLADVPGIEAFLLTLARFHAGLAAAAAGAGEGLGRDGEPPVFTRDALLDTLEDLAAAWERAGAEPCRLAWRALEDHYLADLEGPEARAVALRLAEAAGLTPTAWSAP